MKNFLFSTTRQWNCGDEFILFGVMNILDKLLSNGGVKYNSIIYNRNPAVNPVFHGGVIGKLKSILWHSIPETDNSYHERVDANFIDAAFCAGTPEWCGKRVLPFYEVVSKYRIPFLALGVGSIGNFKRNAEKEVISSAKLITFRSYTLAKAANAAGLNNAKYIPCPALLSANISQEKIGVGDIETIGLGFNIDSNLTVPFIGISNKTYKFQIELFEKLIKTFGNKYQFVGICHYIDELPYAIKFFSKFNIPVRYSFNSQDYFDIYSEIDFLVTSRVHGCGIAASLGIPSVGVSHDERGETINGFLSDVITPDFNIEDCVLLIERAILNSQRKKEEILIHKQDTLNKYIEVLEKEARFLIE